MSAKVERLINLTVALLESRRPLTLAEIRRRIPGYQQDDPESARRMFERDKDDLRSMGVPVLTVALDPFETEWGYRIDRGDYALPSLDLTLPEITALAVALRVAGQDPRRGGFAKLAVRAPDPADRAAPPARVEVEVDALDELAEALVERRTLRFAYTTASGVAGTRTVDPYAVAQRRGAWYLLGRDHDRDDLRAFRLDRIVGAPRPISDRGAFTTPRDLDVAALIAGPAGEPLTVRAAFAPAVAWEATRRGQTEGARPDGWTVVRFDEADRDRLLPWLLGFGADAEVLEPPELVHDLVSRLTAIAGTPGAGRRRRPAPGRGTS